MLTAKEYKTPPFPTSSEQTIFGLVSIYYNGVDYSVNIIYKGEQIKYHFRYFKDAKERYELLAIKIRS